MLRWRQDMGTVLVIVVLASALFALVAGASALRAGLKLRRTRAALQSHLFSEVAQLAGRATELEESITALDARAQALPIRISELQQNLANLGVLTSALGTSLRQTQKVLSFGGNQSSLANAFGSHNGADRQTDHEQDELPRS
ncbi:MAG: hypothetical protein LC751_13820 [Actinobacteria bacterium]|nr:hypothetical protein [Actinomycetota bacterium]